jgi:hypothetical protein
MLQMLKITRTTPTIHGYTCRSTRTHYPDSEPTKHIYDFPT